MYAMRLPVAMATVIPASWAALRAVAFLALMACMSLASSVPSMSIATRRTGGCIGLVYRERESATDDARSGAADAVVF